MPNDGDSTEKRLAKLGSLDDPRERFASSICSQPSNIRAARNCLPVITKRPYTEALTPQNTSAAASESRTKVLSTAFYTIWTRAHRSSDMIRSCGIVPAHRANPTG